jgi:hypothetical protein
VKKSELKKLVSEYQHLKLKLDRHDLPHNRVLSGKLEEIKHRYFHETGNDIESDLKLNARRTA